MPVKLFIASGIFSPEAGGPATYLRELLPELQQRDFEIRVLAYGDNASHTFPYPVERVPRRALPLRLSQYAVAARLYLRWADVVYQHTFDLPLGHVQVPRIGKVVGDTAWERCVRKGWIAPTTDIDDFQTTHYSPLVTWQQQQRNRQAQQLNGVIVPSEYLKRMVVGWGVHPNRVQVIYNALPPHAPGARLPQRKARNQLGLPEAPLILTAARLVHWKGIDHLITALQRIPEVHLLIAGDGELLPTLEGLAEQLRLSGRVHFLGHVNREAMSRYMQAVDYVALYSGYEGLSHTLLEALRAGTPVIASDKGGNPEVVQHGVNGLLVPYVDVDALTDALIEALQPGKRAALAASSGVGLERFDFARMVAQTSAALKSFIQK